MDGERDLWIDFNDIDSEDRGFTLLKFATRGRSIDVGARIVVGDDEGNVCEAAVTGIEDGVVELIVDGDTFRRTGGLGRSPLIGA